MEALEITGRERKRGSISNQKSAYGFLMAGIEDCKIAKELAKKHWKDHEEVKGHAQLAHIFLGLSGIIFYELGDTWNINVADGWYRDAIDLCGEGYTYEKDWYKP